MVTILGRQFAYGLALTLRSAKCCPSWTNTKGISAPGLAQMSSVGHSSDREDLVLLTNPVKHVAQLELNRPKVKNAFSPAMGLKLSQHLRDLEADQSIRCLVLNGNGSDLTAGVDLKSFLNVHAKVQEVNDQSRKSKLLLDFLKSFQKTFEDLYNFPKPVICVYHGITYGLAMELGACSDIRLCSQDAKMAVREVLIGMAADVGSLQELPNLIGNQSLLNELIYTGNDITTDQALELGLVSRVCDTKEAALTEALNLAKTIASRSPVAVQGSKRLLRFSRHKPFSVGLDYSAVWNMSMLQSEDMAKAVEGIIQKNPNGVEYDSY